MPKKIKYTKETLTLIIPNCYSYSDVCRSLGITVSAGNFRTLKRWIPRWGISISHFTGQRWLKGKKHGWAPSTPLADILRQGTHYASSRLKIRLIEGGFKRDVCEICGLGNSWNEMKLVLQLDHINGDHTDNRIENLRVICPNCHTQTRTYSGRNKKLLDSA